MTIMSAIQTGRPLRAWWTATALTLGIVAAPGPAGGQPEGRRLPGERLLEGAGASLVPLSPTRVRRVFEELRLVRESESWRAEVIEFFVGGPIPETVHIGLPEFESPDSLGAPTLSDVRFTVDGFEIAPDSAPAPPEDAGAPAGIRQFHSWRIPFRADEVRAVRLTFRVRPTRTEMGEEMLFFYLNPGTPWAGPSGRINILADLGAAESQDLVADWLRPGDYSVTRHAVQWRMDLEEPDQDLVLVLRAPEDWLAETPDRGQGLLALDPAERASRLGAATARELAFWRAHLWARHGAADRDSIWRAVFEAESWYRASADAAPVAEWSGEERALLAEIEDRLDLWSRRQLPSPEEARQRSRAPEEGLPQAP